MKIVKMASGKTVIKMSYVEWVELGKQAGWGDIGKKVREGLDWAKEKITNPPVQQQPSEQKSTTQSAPKVLDNDEIFNMFAYIKKQLPYSNNNMANPQNMPKIKQYAQQFMKVKGIKNTIEEAIAALQKTNMWGTDSASPASRREIRQSDEINGKFQKISIEEFNKIFKI